MPLWSPEEGEADFLNSGIRPLGPHILKLQKSVSTKGSFVPWVIPMGGAMNIKGAPGEGEPHRYALWSPGRKRSWHAMTKLLPCL